MLPRARFSLLWVSVLSYSKFKAFFIINNLILAEFEAESRTKFTITFLKGMVPSQCC